MAQVQVRAPQAQSVAIGGTPVDAMVGPLLGGYIVNPLAAADQGLPFAEALYVDLVGPAALAQTATTSRLLPGQYFTIPATAGRVSVNALSSGHQFSAYVLRSATQFPPVPAEGTFPPSEPTSLQQIIPAYLYQEYQDDPDLQAFWAAYNTLAQQYVNWFLQIGLPIYTGPLIVGPLLDWIAQGLYGIARPTPRSGLSRAPRARSSSSSSRSSSSRSDFHLHPGAIRENQSPTSEWCCLPLPRRRKRNRVAKTPSIRRATQRETHRQGEGFQ